MLNDYYMQGCAIALEELEKVAGEDFAEKVAAKTPDPSMLRKAKGAFKQLGQEWRMGLTGKMKVPKGKKKGEKVEMFYRKGDKGGQRGQMRDEYKELLRAEGFKPKSRMGYLGTAAGKTAPIVAVPGAAAGGAYYATKD